MIRFSLLLIISASSIHLSFGQDERPLLVSNAQSIDNRGAPDIADSDTFKVAQRSSIPLPPAGSNASPTAQDQDTRSPLITVTSSLAIVLGLFCGFVWLSRKANRSNGSMLNTDLFTILGASQIDARHRAVLAKCGDRILLLALTQTGVTTLTEFTDATEVNNLLAKANGVAKASFAEALNDVSRDNSTRGFIDTPKQVNRSLFSHSGD